MARAGNDEKGGVGLEETFSSFNNWDFESVRYIKYNNNNKNNININICNF